MPTARLLAADASTYVEPARVLTVTYFGLHKNFCNLNMQEITVTTPQLPHT